MLGKNNSYFDIELCLDGHYIVTGYTNDHFCNDMLQLSDVKYELHHYLRHSQDFDAVFFLDSVNMLFCYDQKSYDILRGNETVRDIHTSHDNLAGEIVATAPLGRRRRNRNQEKPQDAQNRRDSGQTQDQNSPLHMGRQAIRVSWEQVTKLLRFSRHRCALVLSNVDSLISSMGVQEMAILEELQSYHSTNHSIVIYMFRETTISTLIDSVARSLGGATNQWSRFVQNVLLNRMETGSPETNRVISLRTPNSKEIENLLHYMRLRPEGGLNIAIKDIQLISNALAASCARQRWGLGHLLTRLDRCISEQPGRQLSAQNWKEFTGEKNYRHPIEQLNQLIGMKSVINDIEGWYAHQLQSKSNRDIEPVSYSRFCPARNIDGIRGHALNIRLKGNPGTGKTTIARLMGMIYYELSLLPQGQLIECSASDLVSQNVGGTARLVRERVQEAMGGVLFIDEAYSLSTNQHGIEAVNQLVSDLSTYEGQFAVVLAGYPNDIDRLMRENDGLARRFPNEYILPDYSAEEMHQIFKMMVERDDDNIVIGRELEEVLPSFCEAWVGGKTRGWGNAGEAETLLTAMKKRCSVRMSADGKSPSLLELEPSDIPENLQHCLAPRSQNLQEAFDEIDKMIGLSNVKKFLKNLSRNILWGVEEAAPGNYIFSGAPGTGKTTVARRMGEILGHLGVLRRKVNNVIECRAADLLNGTVQLTEIVQDARGGILFIDEAHQLEQNERGHSIIRELVPLIEDPEIHADTCFICAGYTAEMKRFLNVDQGLSRRFPINHRIRFDDYTASELVEILETMAADRGVITDCPEFRAYLSRSKAALEKYLEHRSANFGNGGFIRDVYLPESIAARTARLNITLLGDENSLISKEQVESVSIKDRKTLTEEDIPKAFRKFAGPVGKIRRGDRNSRVLLSELYGKEEFIEYVESLFVDGDEDIFFDSSTNVGMHYSIAGPGGSGRHTSIKAMAFARKELGFLEKDDVIFVGKADLEAGYVGQTVIKTQNVVEQAVGGTLVVTYPSALLPKNKNDNSYGPEALGVIVSAMSEHFSDLCVVFLDTLEGMEEFLKIFPSVRSQLSRQFTYDNLEYEDMYKIFELKTKESMVFGEDVKTLLPDFFLNWVSDRGGLGEAAASWGNGKEVDRLINELVQNWKRQDGTSKTDEIDDDGVIYKLKRRCVTRDMFPKNVRKYLTSNRTVSENALQELESMTGLKRVKDSIRVIERRLRRMPSGTVNPGLYCYIGNPGVGKTSVARLMGGILKAAGALSQGHVIIRTARQMCDNVENFDNTIKLAKNGILFIDEAHQLAEETNVYGRSVIKKLLTVLEDADVIKSTCIILAGYPEDMVRLFEVDSGLASRFGTSNSIIRFDDYSSQELLEILDHMAAGASSIVQIGTPYPLRLSEEYRKRSLEIFHLIIESGNPDYGNARFVRNYLHDSVDELLERMDLEYGVDGDPPRNIADYLTEKDIPKKYKSISPKKKRKVMIPPTDILFTPVEQINENNYTDKFDALSQSVVLLETYRDGIKQGEGTGSIITSSGYILTSAHLVKGVDCVRARVYAPGMVGGDYRWFECELLDTVSDDCDMALIQMRGINFKCIPVRPGDVEIQSGEETLLIGFPLGAMLTGDCMEELGASHFSGRIASVQSLNDIECCYIDTTGLHGNSGSPVIAKRDGRMIGVFSGSITPRKDGNLDELNYFYPITYFWDMYVTKG